MRKLTTNEVISRFKKVHGDRYDYSKTDYVGAKSKMVVTCHTHGDFMVILDKHATGGICPKCDVDRMKLDFTKTTEEFISDAKSIHGGKFDYSLVEYVNNKKKITIICPTHGKFRQRSGSHLEGYGCSQCKESMGEREVRVVLENRNVTFDPQHRFPDCKYIMPLPFDFYLPELNVCIEYHGRQHYEHNHFFVTNKGFSELQTRDKIKREYCEVHNINLITIKYDESVSEVLNTNLSI